MGRKKRKASEELEFIELKRKKEIDVDLDITDSFFEEATNTIVKSSEKADLKYYIDIIGVLNSKYQNLRVKYDKLLPIVEIAENKLHTALELTANSDDCLSKFKSALAEAWHEVDASYIREQNAQERMVKIKQTEDCYERKSTKDDDENLGKLSSFKNAILRERDQLNVEVNEIQKRLAMHRYYSESLEYINEKHAESLRKERTSNRVLSSDNGRLTSKNHSLINIIEEMRVSNTHNMQKLEKTNADLNEAHRKLAVASTEHDQMRTTIEKLSSEKFILNRQNIAYTEDLRSLKDSKSKVDEEIRRMRLEDKAKTRLLKVLQDKYKKSTQIYVQMAKKLSKIDRNYNELRHENNTIQNSVGILKKEIDVAANKYNELNYNLELANRDRFLQKEAVVKKQNIIAELKYANKLASETIEGQLTDIQKINLKAEKTAIILARKEKEHNNSAQEVINLNERINNCQTQMATQTETIDELTKDKEQLYFSFSTMKKQLDSAQSNNLILKRKLDICGQDCNDMKNTVTKQNYQVSQMCNEIDANNTTMISLKKKIEHIYNEKKNVQSALQATEATLSGVRTDMKSLRFKNEQLHQTIAEHESKILKMSQDLENALKERNLEGLQLVRRNDEILLLKEKMSIMQNALDNGTASYNQRLEDIRIMKSEILKLQTDRECLKRALLNTANQREEVLRLHRKLNEEQVKVRALTEDLKIPVGVHRWRIMKGEDPEQFEMIQKIQILQKRNMQLDIKYKNVVKELETMKETNKSLENNEKHLLKMYDTGKKLIECQRINRDQDKKLKAMTAELRICQIEADEQNGKRKSYSSEKKLSKKETMSPHVSIGEDSNISIFQDQALFEFSTDNLQSS